MPDFIYVLLDGSVGCELSAACGIQHCHLSPSGFVSVSFFDTFLCVCIGTEVCQNEVSICTVAALGIQQRIVDLTESFRIIRCIFSVDQLHQHTSDILIAVEDVFWMISAILFIVDNFVCGQTEDECILFSNFFYDLDIGTVHGSKSRSTVQHELHVTGSGCFLGSCGNLFGYICCCKDPFCVGYAVIFNEDYFQFILNRSIIVNHICHGVDQLNGQFGTSVTGCCLCAEDECSWIEIHFRMVFDLVVQIHYMKDIQ